MYKKMLRLLYACFIFAFCAANADIIHEPNIIKINGILVYESVANYVVKDATDKHLNIFNAKNERIQANVVTKNVDITIRESKLMDEVARLYAEAMLSSESANVAIARSEQMNIVITLDKRKKIIVSLFED